VLGVYFDLLEIFNYLYIIGSSIILMVLYGIYMLVELFFMMMIVYW